MKVTLQGVDLNKYDGKNKFPAYPEGDYGFKLTKSEFIDKSDTEHYSQFKFTFAIIDQPEDCPDDYLGKKFSLSVFLQTPDNPNYKAENYDRSVNKLVGFYLAAGVDKKVLAKGFPVGNDLDSKKIKVGAHVTKFEDKKGAERNDVSEFFAFEGDAGDGE